MNAQPDPGAGGAHDPAREVFDSYAGDYSQTIDQSLTNFGARHDHFTRHKADLIKALLSARQRDSHVMDLVDVGCGTAELHHHLGGSFRTIRGVDLSAESIAIAKRSHPDNMYATYDGGALPYAAESADLVLAVCVFHHVPPGNWGELAAQMMRILRPNGLALVIEHNPWNPVTRHIVNTCPIDRDAVLLSRPRLAELFRSAGAHALVSRSILSVPAFSPAMMRLDALFGRLPFGAQHYCLAVKAETGLNVA